MTIPDTFKKNLWLHILLWCLVGLIFYFGTRGTDYKPGLYISQAVLVPIFSMIPFYGTAYYIIPRFLYKKRYLMLVPVLVIFILLNDLLQFVVIRSILNLFDNHLPIIPEKEEMRTLLYLGFWNNCLCVFIAGGLKILSDHLRMEKKLAQSEKEKIATELSFLKNQVNPHFLFNVMNTIYFQIDKGNTAARTTVEKFADMLRYQLYECNADVISLEKEINYLKNYVQVQLLRMEKETNISFSAEGDFSQVTIAPLLLLPLVENAFKHVSHFANASDNVILIEIKYIKPLFVLKVMNTVDDKSSTKLLLNEGGLGLQNVKRRLELIYSDKFNIEHGHQPGRYSTSLQIHLR